MPPSRVVHPSHLLLPPPRRRRTLRLIAGGAALVYWMPAPLAVLPPLPDALGVHRRLRSRPGVMLTFDDGPHPEATPAVLEALAAAGAVGTFFLAGEAVREHPAVVHEILAGGNEIGVHCDRHRNLLRLAPGQTVADLNAAERTIVEVADRPCSLYRPPYGILTAAAVVHARRRGWSTLLWNRHGRDWRPEATPETIAAGVGGGFRPGDVVLLHDSDFYSGPGRWRHTVAALPAILAAVAASGLSTCLPEAPA